MKPIDTQASTTAEASTPEQAADELERDAARLHREIETFDTRTKAIGVERAAKKRELEGVTRKLVQIRIKGMK